MAAADISVQRVRLVADRHVSGHALRARVEDALRISSKPPALAHRFVLLRRLRLRLPREASAQSLALQLEAQWREIESLAQPLARASSEAAAVWAADELQARLLLLQRWLRGEPTEAWFWHRLLPAARPSMPLAQRLAMALFVALDTAPTAAAQAQATHQRWQREALRQIVAAGRWPALWVELQPLQRAALHALMAGAEAAALDPATPVKGVASPSLQPAAAATMVNPAVTPAEAQPAAPQQAVRRDAASPTALPRPAAAPWPRTAVPPLSATLAAPRATSDREADLDGVATAWAGLWFLLPLLQRQGLDDQPDAASLLAAVLQRAAQRCPLDAAASAWVEQVSEQAKSDTPAFQVDAWWRRARFACMRQTRLPLRRLLHRPGRAWLSPHRIDLMLPLASADIRIRRAGCDIDPGYVPWLDCVIHFHYVR